MIIDFNRKLTNPHNSLLCLRYFLAITPLLLVNKYAKRLRAKLISKNTKL